MIKTNYNLFIVIVALVALSLYSYGVYIGSVDTVILGVFNFVILLEITRVLTEFVLSGENRVKLRYIIDGTIVFSARELYVGFVKIKDDWFLGTMILGISVVAMGALIFYRTKLVKYSPDFFKD